MAAVSVSVSVAALALLVPLLLLGPLFALPATSKWAWRQDSPLNGRAARKLQQARELVRLCALGGKSRALTFAHSNGGKRLASAIAVLQFARLVRQTSAQVVRVIEPFESDATVERVERMHRNFIHVLPID